LSLKCKFFKLYQMKNKQVEGFNLAAKWQEKRHAIHP
jgi:hypothetical protein